MTEPADYISVLSGLARLVTKSASAVVAAIVRLMGVSGGESGDCEALTATAFIRRIRIFELKGPVQTTLGKVDSGACQVG